MASTDLASTSSQQHRRELNALLKRLDRNILSPDADDRLKYSSTLRTKAGFVGCQFLHAVKSSSLTIWQNVEHARNLLSRLEQDEDPTSSKRRGGGASKELQEQRAVIKRLQSWLSELDEADHFGNERSDAEDESGSSDIDEILNRFGPAVKTANAGLDVNVQDPPAPDPSQQTTMQAAKALESTLRSRNAGQRNAQAADTASTTGRAGAAQASPFAPKNPIPPSSDTETLMNHHAAEQENLSDALLSLATALKDSTFSFSESLDASNPLVDQATGALDKSAGGMEAAQKRTGMLRRMTEGKGKLGRIILYLWVGGLWVVLILIMFVMPKLRF